MRQKDIYESVEREEVRRPYELPEDWRWVKLGNAAEMNRESRNPEKEMPDGEFAYIDITGIAGGTGKIKEAKKIVGRDAPSRARRVVHTNDVIMSTVRPYLRAFAIIPSEYDNQICSTGFAVFTCHKSTIPQYLLYVLFSDMVVDQCNRMMIGAHYPALNNSQVSGIVIPLPPVGEQKRIVAYLDQIWEKSTRLEKLHKATGEKINKLRSSILNKASRGEL